MVKRRVRLEGPGARGIVVNAALLRDLLALILDGSQRALRIRTQGRSTARGTLPRWIAAATQMDVRIVEGSTVLEIDAPTLLEADPEEFGQRDLFPEVDPQLTGLDYLSDSLDAAAEADERGLYDKPLLELFLDFNRVFEHGIESVSIEGRRHDAPTSVRLKQEDLARFAELETKIPAPQEVNVAGKLDSIRHSDRTFTLLLPHSHESIKGIADPAQLERLQGLWGKAVLVSGVAHFAADDRILRIEATSLKDASDRDIELWAFSPKPLGARIAPGDLRVLQGPRTGLNAIIGQWPGEEADEEIERVLEQLS